MKRWLLVLLAPLCVLSAREAVDRQSGRTEFTAWAADANYVARQTRALTPGASYVGTDYYRESDACRLVAIPVQRGGEMWAVLPALIGQAAFRSGHLFDGVFRPLPATGTEFALGRVDSRLRQQRVSAEAHLVFGEAACLAE
ncbi:hypothetical protein [Nisaea sp.]|uniref:hypothetical protein n=1 Tax=Nisaea sp. TaxID=2024842 RepID=UPI002B26D85A|nr:hypothetical protein [Nisaea sp.]